MNLRINGRERDFFELDSDSRLVNLLGLLELKPDRVAVERNGAIVARAQWQETLLSPEDRLEIVQFVGGGA